MLRSKLLGVLMLAVALVGLTSTVPSTYATTSGTQPLVALVLTGPVLGSGVYLSGSTIRLAVTITNTTGYAMPFANITSNRYVIADAAGTVQANFTTVSNSPYVGQFYVYYTMPSSTSPAVMGQWSATWTCTANQLPGKARVTFYVSN
jgi:hypothetical protein